MRLTGIIFCIACIGLLKCGSEDESTPEAVVKEFAQALEDKDYDKLKTLCTRNTEAMVEVYKLTGGLLTSQSNELEKNEVTCRTEGDEATCLNCCLNDGAKRQYDLRKEDGKWKVEFRLTYETPDTSLGTEPIEPEVEPVEDAVVY